MDKKKIIKTAINVLPIIIVPLVVERKRIKSSLRYKSNHATSNAGQAIANKATGAKEYLGDKNKNSTTNELKKIAKKMILNTFRKAKS